MAVIQKLAIRGIRSFSPEDEQVRTERTRRSFVVQQPNNDPLMVSPPITLCSGYPVLQPPDHDRRPEWMRQNHYHRVSQVFMHWQTPTWGWQWTGGA